jgi:hypothetical protein
VRQANAKHGTAVIVWLIACGAAAAGIGLAPKEVRVDVACVLAAVALGGLAVIYAEHRRNAGGEGAALFATVATASVLALTLVMRDFDGYRPSAEFGRRVSAMVDGPVTLVDLGEAHVAYYLDPIPRRADDADAFAKSVAASAAPAYAVTSEGVVDRLTASGLKVDVLDEVRRARRSGREDDRVVLVRVAP